MKCDLCKKGDAAHGIIHREVGLVCWCWKCDAKLPTDPAQMSAAIRSVMLDDQSLNCAVMFATGQGPRLVTDDTFFAGWQTGGGAQFGNANRPTREGYLGEAKRAGVSTNGKVYMHGLADYPGDPRAWVSTRGEIVKRLEERGWGCERLGVKARTDLPPPPEVRLADDIVDEFVERKIATEGIDRKRLTPDRLAEMREQVTNTHGRKKEPTVTRPRKKKKRSRR